MDDLRRRATRLYGVDRFCLDHGRYALSSDAAQVTCSIHGSMDALRKASNPAASSPEHRLIRDFTDVTAALTFLEDGLHAVVRFRRK